MLLVEQMSNCELSYQRTYLTCMIGSEDNKVYRAVYVERLLFVQDEIEER
jgi:hypothetical protein